MAEPRTKTSQYDKVKEITAELEASIHAIFENPESNLRRWLDVCSAFHNYSLNNTLLIAAQLPEGASGPIAGMTTWNKLGRKVIKGSKAIHILAPAPYRRKVEVECRDPVTGNVMLHPDGSVMKEIKEVIQPAFKVVNCFYYGQTEGKPLPTLEINELTGNVKDYDFFFEAIRRYSPVPIGFEKIEGGAKGYFSPGENRIAINEGMSQVQTVKTGLHELIHVSLHGEHPLFAELVDGKTPMKSRNQKETEAEAACYCIANFFGIDTSDYSTLYVGSWASDKELPELKASLETIRKTADQLITKITDHLKDIHRERGVIQENALPEANAAESEKSSVLLDLNEKKQKAKTELSKDSLPKSDKRKTEKSKQEEAL